MTAPTPSSRTKSAPSVYTAKNAKNSTSRVRMRGLRGSSTDPSLSVSVSGTAVCRRSSLLRHDHRTDHGWMYQARVLVAARFREAQGVLRVRLIRPEHA